MTYNMGDQYDTPHVHALSDALEERAIDARVWRRLATDAAYRNAESAEEQAEREAEITREEEERFYHA